MFPVSLSLSPFPDIVPETLTACPLSVGFPWSALLQTSKTGPSNKGTFPFPFSGGHLSTLVTGSLEPRVLPWPRIDVRSDQAGFLRAASVLRACQRRGTI